MDRSTPVSSASAVVTFSCDLTKASEMLPKKECQQLEEQLGALEGEPVRASFHTEHSSIVETKVLDSMEDFIEDHKNEFKSLDNTDHMKDNMGKILSLSNMISSEPGLSRRPLTEKRNDKAISIMTSTSKGMVDLHDDNLLRQMIVESDELLAKYSEATAGLTKKTEQEVSEYERSQLELSQKLETCQATSSTNKEALAAKKASAQARFEKAQLMAQEQEQIITEAQARKEEALQEASAAKNDLAAAETEETDLEEETQDSMDEIQDDIERMESLLKMARTELRILKVWETVLPPAIRSICEGLNSKVAMHKDKFAQMFRLINDLYLCLSESMKKQEAQYTQGAQLADAGVKELNPAILTLENVGDDPADLKELVEKREKLQRQSDVLKGAVGTLARKRKILEGVRVETNAKFSVRFGEIQTEPHHISKEMYDVVVSRAVDPVTGQEEKVELRMGIKDIFYTKDEIVFLERWWERLEEARRQKLLAIQNGTDANNSPQQDILYELAADDPALKWDPNKLTFEGDCDDATEDVDSDISEDDSLSVHSCPDGQVPP